MTFLMQVQVHRWPVVALLTHLVAAAVPGQELVVKPEEPGGLYQPGQPVRWGLEVKGADMPELSYVLKTGGFVESGGGTVALSDGRGFVEATPKAPGWQLVEVTGRPAGGKNLRSLGGALIAPEAIQPAQTRPEDFDRFWQSKLKELASVPARPLLTAAESGRTNVEYFKISLNNIRGSRIRGQLARPTAGGRFPALLIVQWAGVYPLQRTWVTDRAAEGWLVLNLNAHDLPIDEPEQYYKDQAAGPLKDYPSIGNDDRETSYFLRMYLSCHRGAEYLAGRPDWDGRTLAVTGGSQGGLQSIVTAALHPEVTAVMANVPAGCDLNGPAAQRLPGWPMWHWNTKGKDEAKVREAARYFDVVNFAPRVRCPVLVGVGLIDTVCPPPGVFAACNRMQGPKEIVVLPLGEHQEVRGSHRPYYERAAAWSQALLKGEPIPLQLSNGR